MCLFKKYIIPEVHNKSSNGILIIHISKAFEPIQNIDILIKPLIEISYKFEIKSNINMLLDLVENVCK